MLLQHQLLNTDSKFSVLPYGNGLKLIKPPSSYHHFASEITMEALLKQSFCVYLTNTESAVLQMNEHAIAACGFHSLDDAIGKTIFDVATKKTAEYVTGGHKEVLKNKRIKILEEDVIKKDSLSFQCLTTILPLYNAENKICGIFGCSVIPGVHSLANSLEQMSKLGILNSPENDKRVSPFFHSSLGDIYLSKRETECVTLLAKGNTAKEIAAQLNLSPRTIEHYIENVKNKLGVSTKSELLYKIFNQQ